MIGCGKLWQVLCLMLVLSGPTTALITVTAAQHENNLAQSRLTETGKTTTENPSSIGQGLSEEQQVSKPESSSADRPPFSQRLEIFKNEEFALIGGIKEGVNNRIFDETANGTTTLFEWETDFGANVDAAFGNLDNDAELELVTTGLGAKTVVYDDSSHSFAVLREFNDGGQDALAVGDVDGDGLDEIVLFCRSLIVLDDKLHNFTQLFASNETVFDPNPNLEPSNDPYNERMLQVEDLDGDGLAEIVVLAEEIVDYDKINVIYAVLDDYFENFTQIFRKQEVSTSYLVDMDIGDVNGDHRNELICFTQEQLKVYGYNSSQHSLILIDSYDFNEGTIWLRLTVGYLRFREAKETIILSYLSTTSSTASERQRKGPQTTSVIKQQLFKVHTGELVKVGSSFTIEAVSQEMYPFFFDLKLANLDDDYNPEFIVVISEGEEGTRGNLQVLKIYDDIDTSGTLLSVREYENYDPDEYPRYPSIDRPAICVGDVDGDSVVGQFINHNFTMSNPIIFTVLAAPPTISGIDQNYDDSATSYEISNTEQVELESGYAVSVGVTVSYETGFHIGPIGAEIELSASLSREIERSMTRLRSITWSKSYSTDSLDDYVIFETMVYDHYYYKIVSHVDPSQIGKIFVITIPHEPTIYKWTVSYYNEHNGEYYDIGSEIFKHTVGQAWTYPTPALRDKIMDQYKEDGAWRSPVKMAVGQGGGSNAVSIDLLTEQTSSESLSFTVEASASFHVGPYTQGFTVGKTSHQAYSVTIGKNTLFEGCVGDIGADDYATYRYSFGLFVYNYHKIEDEKVVAAFQVINYWVEDYEGPWSPPTEDQFKILNNLKEKVSGFQFEFILTMLAIGRVISWNKKRKRNVLQSLQKKVN